MRLIDTYVAPWALPNERFPIHAVWNPPTSVDQIRISGPEELRVTSAYNSDITEVEPGFTTLSKPPPWDFVTVFFKYAQIPDQVLLKAPVTMEFLKQGRAVQSVDLRATIVRPRLEILDFPAQVELTDTDDTAPTIVANLRQSGFGPIRINIEARFQGRIVTEKTLLARQIATSLIKSGLSSTRLSPTASMPGAAANVAIDASLRDDIAKEVDRLIREGPAPEDVDESSLKEFAQLIKERGAEAFVDFLKSVVETWFIDYLLNVVRSNPGEQAELIGGPTRALIESKMDSIDVSLSYHDPMGNAYENLVFRTAIRDNRSKQDAISIGLNLALKTELLTRL